jgi:2-polyprenyl-6-methoxyphenol hydroxylase-like FAD-dependent oxidoreductase
MSTANIKPILIAGAGIGGLALAQGLRKGSIPFRVFEREAALNVRSQGYRVRINEYGQNALKSLLEPAHYEQFIKSCPSNPTGLAASAFLDALTGEERESPAKKFGSAGRPPAEFNAQQMNVDRGVLRDVLMLGLEADVEFGKEVTEYEIVGGEVRLRFSDKTEVAGSFLVGADGARSKIRKQFLPNSELLDTEARLFYGKTPLTKEFLEAFEPKALEGMTLFQDRSGETPLSLLLEAMRFRDNEFRKNLPQDYVYWALFTRKEFFATKSDAELLAISPTEAAELTRSLTSHWKESIRPLFEYQNVAETSILRIATSYPILPFWESSPYVTILGDAIHVMSPTAAVGATTALRDAATLAQHLVEGGINKENIRKYEQHMRAYAGEAIQQSMFGGKIMFGMKPFQQLDVIQDGYR